MEWFKQYKLNTLERNTLEERCACNNTLEALSFCHDLSNFAKKL